jgi:glutamine synthetase
MHTTKDSLDAAGTRRPAAFEAEVSAFLAAHPETRAVELLFSDINGIARGMQFPVSILDGLGSEGANIPATALLLDAKGAVLPGRLGAEFQGDPDAWFRAVPGTLLPVPWSGTPAAQVLTTAHDETGAPLYFDPRAVLARAARPLAEAGLTAVIALESEFYLCETGAHEPRPAEPSGNLPRLTGPQCLSIEALYDFAPFLRDVEALCAGHGVPLTSILAEYGDAQFEANLHHVDDPLRACDHLTLLKRIVKAAARRRDMVAAFMAKPMGGVSGSGLHVHVSLTDAAGRNVFAGKRGQRKLHHAVAGVLAAMPESIALFCPNANSYRRFQPESYVPQGISWGPNHRAVAVRVPPSDDANRRLEHRVAGADACPYLMVAAVLAGIHHGLAGELDPPAMTGAREALNETAPFPTRWPTALDAFAGARILPHYLGEAFCNLYLQVKRIEEARFNAAVTAHDHDWYFRVL